MRFGVLIAATLLIGLPAGCSDHRSPNSSSATAAAQQCLTEERLQALMAQFTPENSGGNVTRLECIGGWAIFYLSWDGAEESLLYVLRFVDGQWQISYWGVDGNPLDHDNPLCVQVPESLVQHLCD